MRNTLAIAGKELKAYFTSPIAYVITAVFLALTGYFFAQDLFTFQFARLHGFLGAGSFLLLLIAPILTMRLIAEEQKLGTLELLLTAPVRDHEIVLGKFLAAVAILAAMLAITLYYPLLLTWVSDPDLGPMLSGYLGLFLLGAAFLAVGLFTSSLTSNQIVAATLGIGISLLFYLVDSAETLVRGVPAAVDVLRYISLNEHFSDFLRGVIDTKAVIYYGTFVATLLFLTVRSVESRRWR